MKSFNTIKAKYKLQEICATGFTLAEVLITLGIIGIVAELTIPTVVSNTREASWHVAWKKEYSTISQAYDNLKVENGDLTDLFSKDTEASVIFQELNKKLSIAKDCGDWYYELCDSPKEIDKTYRTLNGSYLGYYTLGYHQEILNDGAHIMSRKQENENLILWVDVNGVNNGPNTLGKDLYGMILNKRKVIPFGAIDSGVENTCSKAETTCPTSYGFHPYDCAGAGCSSKVLMNEKIDYDNL